MPAAEPLTLTDPIESVPGVGPEFGAALRALGVPSVAHLVHYLPFRHELEEAESNIASLTQGRKSAARGMITATRVGGFGRKRRFEAVLMDDTGRLDLLWFHRPGLHHSIHPGVRLLVTGEPRTRGPYMQMVNPWFRVLEDDAEPPRRAARLRPIYPASERISSLKIERAIAATLGAALPLIDDHLSDDFRRSRDFPSLAESYRMMHQPRDEEEIARARRRLAYDELLFLQLAILRDRFSRDTRPAPALAVNAEIDARIRARIPFTLTAGQDAAIADIVRDIARDRPANRLIQGDVGSGKTVVALYAMLAAVACGRQAALMAPTELLAEQHYDSISRLLAGSRVRVDLLSASMSAGDRAAVESAISAGRAHIVIGTHALLTERVAFDNLAVVVIDEQHRFGVRQQSTIATGDRVSAPHSFVMTATPIPRSLTQTIFGDLDITTIRGMPPGRGSIETIIRTPTDMAEIDTLIAERASRGEQVYVVVPAIESDDRLRDIETTRARIEAGPLAGRRVAVAHGRLRAVDRQRVMDRFRAGEIDALIATTVIEVGVDVPNATLMVIEHAERFGLAQLHQLRGRVGRGGRDSQCVLVAEPTTPDAEQRIAAIASTTDGFVLAEKDLEIRGPGDLAGFRQSGAPALRVADLVRDQQLVALARRDARDILSESPRLNRPQDALLARRLDKALRAAGE